MKNTPIQYTPKAVRGIKFPGHIRINRAQLKKLFRQPAFTFSGFIVGNNVNSFHFFGGWHLALTIENRNQKDMTETLNGFEFHLESELGNRAAIYLKKTPSKRKQAIPQVCTMLPLL
jgi:hypothetical protein